VEPSRDASQRASQAGFHRAQWRSRAAAERGESERQQARRGALLGQIRELCSNTECAFTRRDLRQKCGWSETQLRCHLRELEAIEIIEPVAGKQGKEFVYHLGYDTAGKPLGLEMLCDETLLDGCS